VVLVLNEPVTVAAAGLVVLDGAGHSIAVDQIASAREGRAVTGRIPQPLPPGVYTVRWRVIGADGDLVESTFRFAVGAAITGEPTSQSGAGTAWPAAGLRWLLLTGLALALGGVWRVHGSPQPAPARLEVGHRVWSAAVSSVPPAIGPRPGRAG